METTARELLAPWNLEPARTVLLCDIDGTLAPITDSPEGTAVPPKTLGLLEAAVDRCAAAGCVTGRMLEDARQLVPVEGLWLLACHGMHVLTPAGEEDVDPVALAAREQLQLAATLGQTVGWRYEDKGHSVTFHFRHVATPELTAQQMRAQIATVLDPRVVEVHDARMALEVRPAGARTKRDAVLRVLEAAGERASSVLYIGDDRTDLDAFAALEQSGLQGVRVAVASDEAPAELLERADLVLDGQHEVAPLLAGLLR